MILEGIVTTLNDSGDINIAPMGPIVQPDMRRFQLRPFKTAQTYRNLKGHPEGVFHVTDDVLILAQAAVGQVEPMPPMHPAPSIRGQILSDACRFYEFRVVSFDDTDERTTLEAEVVHSGRLRDFFGFNRAKHAVLEAAILATRIHFLEHDFVQSEYDKLHVLVSKTGDAREIAAFEFLQKYVWETHQRTSRSR